MSKFEDRLWRQIVREHGADLAQMRTPEPKHAWRSRPRMLAGTTFGLAGIGTAAALLLGAASSSPAFAVTRNPDGTVSVTIKQLSGIAGANQRLASLGIRAKAVAVGAGCDSNWTVKQQVIAGGPPPKPTNPAQLHALVAARMAAGAKIDPGKIPAGRTVVIATWRAASRSTSTRPVPSPDRRRLVWPPPRRGEGGERRPSTRAPRAGSRSFPPPPAGIAGTAGTVATAARPPLAPPTAPRSRPSSHPASRS